MVQGSYNPQQVLSSLMARFGRHFEAARTDGLDRMANVVAEELHIDGDNARKLLTCLQNFGLLRFEAAAREAPPIAPARMVRLGGKGEGHVAENRAVAEPKGVWCIGPNL